MDLDKFVKENRDYFKWNNIEDASGIPNSALRAFIAGRRKLSDESFKKLRIFFDRFGIELEYEKKSVRKKPQKISVGDMVPRDGWIQLLGSVMKNGSMRGRLEDGKIRVISV